MLHRVCRVTGLLGFLAVGALSRGTAVADPLDRGSTLCLHPVEIPVAEKDDGERRVSLERRLRDALIAASFAVPDPQAVSDLVKRIETSTGGFVDAATGRRDEAHYRAFREQHAAALRSELGCDAQLSARVARVRARFAGGTARWDGTTDSVSSTGRVVLQALGGVHESGWVAALSLWLHAFDLEGNDLAFRSAGIETLVNMAVLREQDVLPEDLWLTNVEKLNAAIQSALGPNGELLRHHGVPGGVPAPPTPAAEDVRRMMGRPSRSDQR